MVAELLCYKIWNLASKTQNPFFSTVRSAPFVHNITSIFESLFYGLHVFTLLFFDMIIHIEFSYIRHCLKNRKRRLFAPKRSSSASKSLVKRLFNCVFFLESNHFGTKIRHSLYFQTIHSWIFSFWNLLNMNHNFPFAVAFATFTADIVFILQGFHYSLYGAERFSGCLGQFLLFDSSLS